MYLQSTYQTFFCILSSCFAIATPRMNYGGMRGSWFCITRLYSRKAKIISFGDPVIEEYRSEQRQTFLFTKTALLQIAFSSKQRPWFDNSCYKTKTPWNKYCSLLQMSCFFSTYENWNLLDFGNILDTNKLQILI